MKNKAYHPLKIFLLTILIGSTVFLVFTTFFILITISQVKELDTNLLYKNDTIRIYDNQDNLITTLGSKKSEWISINEISENMKNAIVSIEDERFFSHKGIDYKRIFSAAFHNVKKGSLQEGASTINQQLIKNVYLSNEKTFTRKIKEIYLAVKLDKKLTKDQILECYLNNILFGKQIIGIKDASLYYFYKDPSDLTITEAAFLAGMVQLPNYYNPDTNYEASLNRRNLVLKKMHELGYIKDTEIDSYLNHPLKDDLKENRTMLNFSLYSSYLDLVINELRSDYEYDGEIKIYTNYDSEINYYIHQIMTSDDFLCREEIQAGIVAMDCKSGAIEGIGGLRRPDVSGINYAITKHQPGSTIKPILDFAPAIEYLNYGTGTLIDDSKINYQNGSSIHNWDYKYKGLITTRQALVESRNIPALKLFKEVGPEKCFNLARKAGLNPEDDIYEANSIGGFTYGYSVLEMTNAYQALANNGIYIEGKTIRYVEGAKKIKEATQSVAMSYQTAYMINDMLIDIANITTPIKGLKIAAKTGQTNFDANTLKSYNIPKGAVKDSWYIGYTPDKVLGVWTGFSNVSSINYFDQGEKNICRNIFKELISKYAPYNHNSFYKPDNIVYSTIDKKTGRLATNETPYSDKATEIFLRGSEPKS